IVAAVLTFWICSKHRQRQQDVAETVQTSEEEITYADPTFCQRQKHTTASSLFLSGRPGMSLPAASAGGPGRRTCGLCPVNDLLPHRSGSACCPALDFLLYLFSLPTDSISAVLF
ncbi:hypothetical protein IRJ41_021844, partial [Triplophysa rosa]